MAGSSGKSVVGRFGVHLAVLFFVALWTVPTLGILISSLRDKDQIVASGWWTALTSSTRTEAGRLGTAADQVEKDGKFQIAGNLLESGGSREIVAFGTRLIESSRMAGTISQPASPVISFQPSAPLKIECQSACFLLMMLASGSITKAASTRPASSCARATAKLALTTVISLPRSMPFAAQ